MTKTLLTAAALVALTVPAMAQDKSGTTYTPQPAAAATAPTPVYKAEETATTTSYDSGGSVLSGAYIGAYGGYGWTDADTAATTYDVDGADYGIFVGYKLDQLLQNSMGITAAIEAFYGWSNADDEVAGVTVEKDHEWGINLRPGMSFLSFGTSINPYGILGYRRTNFETSGAGDDSYDGFDLGIGTELVAWGNIGMRVDYTHTFYEENNGIDPDEDNIRVGLSYHF